MLLKTSRVEVWAADLANKPGALAGKLEPLALAGADLKFIIARRHHGQPDKGVVFITPLTGGKQIAAAREAGFAPAGGMVSVRVEGPDEPGIAYRITSALAQAGINLRGVSAGCIGDRCLFYLAFDSEADAQQAMGLIAML
ncbi:MAG: ACT domain-containing protein [Phycisphaerales bacterium]